MHLRDCLDHPLILPANAYGVRDLVEEAAKQIGRAITPAFETESFDLIRHYVTREAAVGFQIPIGLNAREQGGIAHRPLPERDVRPGQPLLGQMKGRTLPVASARFGQQLAMALDELTPAR